MRWEKVDFTADEFRILTNTASNYTMKRYHFHDSYEIYYLVSGSRDYFIADHIYHVNKGNLVLIRPRDLHKTIETGESHSRVLIGFSPSFFPVKKSKEIINQCFSESRILTLDSGARGNVESRIENLIAASKSNSAFRMSRLQCEFAAFLIDTAEFIGKTNRKKGRRKNVNHTVSRMLPYLKANYTRQLTLDELCREFFVSRYHITRIFKGETGFTIFEYIHSLRILEAQRLLKETSMKVIEVSQEVGYSNVSNFGKVFKSITGVSPMNYRRHHLGKK